ncbi:BrnT family toxin [Carnimonas bestiolae]|uniref:BrnT family toxin n=1 Tax=Carnimonas bestiolae TaxID=3402172 RepID=UPI003F4AE855
MEESGQYREAWRSSQPGQSNAVALFEDTRHDYKEVRNITFGYVVKQRLYVAVWHERNGVIRSISVRKAKKWEVNRYGTQ